MSIPSQKVSSSNKLIYQRLKQAIDLNLRRQIFIAACDDLCLRDCLAARLQTELGSESAGSPIDYPRFVSLELDLSDPNPWGSIAAWLTQHPPPQNRGSYSPLPGFQILGAEHLTRHSAAVQWSFLSYLRDIEAHLQMCESTLLLWVSRPWLSSIEQSAPEFWHWRTGVFEFEGEPTPAKGDFGHFEDFDNSGNLGNLRDKGDSGDKLLISSLSEQSPTPHKQFPIPDSQFPIPDSKSVELADLVLAAASSEELEAENNAESEDNFLPLQALQYIELLQEHQCCCEALALAYHSLGNYYRDRILGGDASEQNLTIAIRAIEQVIAYLELDANSQQNPPLTEECALLISELTQNLTQYAQQSYSLPPISDLLNDLGTFYWMLSRDRTQHNASDPVSCLERSIALYLEGLNRTDAETVPQTRVRLNKNLGIASADLARYRDKTENLQQAVAAYQQALLDLDPALEPQQYAAAQNNLATAYWNLAQDGEPIAYLKSAIAAYAQALSCYSPEREPLNYAGVQNNLGTACWNLAQHEPSEPLLVRAIEAYREALKYRTRELVPAAAAATYNNLGTAYWHLAKFQQKQARTESLQQAITAYEAALDIAGKLDRTQLTFDALAARNNLGLAHYQLATDADFGVNKAAQTSHLEAALHHQLQVCAAEWGQHLKDKGLTYGDKLNLQAPANSQAADSRQTALSYIVKTIRAFYSECGLPGQNLALSKVPGDLLPEILRRL
ncbi:tetratricopeptide repeat protein [Microcoleus sp. N3A4]|uniref:tetratricopeptide repeat protein n=1 Tax=Microcoleus sp. N3A4 TaxID=3055379 RepID=UPI002FCEDE6F